MTEGVYVPETFPMQLTGRLPRTYEIVEGHQFREGSCLTSSAQDTSFARLGRWFQERTQISALLCPCEVPVLYIASQSALRLYSQSCRACPLISCGL